MRRKNWIALLLALTMLFGSVSFTLAEEADGSEEPAATETADPADTPAPTDTPAPEESAEPEESPAPEESAEPEEVNETAYATTPFNIRSERDLASKMIRNIAKGDKLIVTAFYEDGWCKVKFNTATVGYAKTSWLRFPNMKQEDVPQENTVSASDDPGTPVYDTEGLGFDTPKATENPVVPEVDSSNPREAVAIPEGVSIGESDTDEIAYVAMTLKGCKIWDKPDTTEGRRIGELKKGARLNILAYGDDWCKVRSWNGQVTGYVMSKFIFHYHSNDPFKYNIPWYNSYKSTGYISVTKPIRITDRRDLYKGQQMQVGDIVCCRLREDGDYDILLRRDWVTIPKEYGEYHPFVSWDEAKKGDVIGGFTLFYGIGQGGKMKRGRATNIGIAMRSMDGVLVGSGKKYSFLTNLGPVSAKYGYKVAGVIGGNGRGVGGGICHTSSLTYSAILSLPMFIYEREPHTDDGVFYIPLEFDATVGGWSDFVYYNTLPYMIKHHAFYNSYNGNITLYFECVETKTEEELKNWDWKTLPIPKSKDEGG